MMGFGRLRRLAWGLALILPAAATVLHAQSAGSAPLVFEHVTVVDVETGKLAADQRVVIAGHRIAALGSAKRAKLPAAATIVDATGKFLIPGMWDMHVHPREFTDIAFPLLIANGVTGVRDAHSPVPLATMVEWKREIAAGTRVGPRYLVSGPSLDEKLLPDGSPDLHGKTDTVRSMGYMSLMITRGTIAHAVDSLHDAGADFVKLYGMTKETWFLAAREARRLGMLFGGHMPGGLEGPEASDSGATFLDHASGYGDHCRDQGPDSIKVAQCLAAAEPVAERVLARNNAWIPVVRIPMDALSVAWRRAFQLRYWPRSQQYFWLTPPQRDSAAAAAPSVDSMLAPMPTSTAGWRAAGMLPTPRIIGGAGLLSRQIVGTDNYIAGADGLFEASGFGVPRHLLGFVIDGMTPLQALQAGTLNPVKALRATDSLGTVAAGKLADLVLLDANPLEDIWNTTKVRAVVANGRYFDRAALDALLHEAEARAKQD